MSAEVSIEYFVATLLFPSFLNSQTTLYSLNVKLKKFFSMFRDE